MLNMFLFLCGRIEETQEMVNFCATHKLFPDVELIDAKDINHAIHDLVDGKNGVSQLVSLSSIPSFLIHLFPSLLSPHSPAAMSSRLLTPLPQHPLPGPLRLSPAQIHPHGT